LDPKHRYLASAPVSDPDGNKAQVRYSRKAREQYVMTEVDGKVTGWKAICPNCDGQWLVEEKSQSSARSRKKTVRKKATKKKAVKKKTARKKAVKKKTARKKAVGKRVKKGASASQNNSTSASE
jgi:DNA topoisomerase-1